MIDALKVVGMVAFIVLVIWVVIAESHQRDRYIQSWAESKGIQGIDSEYCAWNLGPYWYRKTCSVYHVTGHLADGTPVSYWIRYGAVWSGFECYKEDSPGHYEEEQP